MPLSIDPETGLFWGHSAFLHACNSDALRLLRSDYEALGATALRLVPANAYRDEGLVQLVQSWECMLRAVRLADRRAPP